MSKLFEVSVRILDDEDDTIDNQIYMQKVEYIDIAKISEIVNKVQLAGQIQLAGQQLAEGLTK